MFKKWYGGKRCVRTPECFEIVGNKLRCENLITLINFKKISTVQKNNIHMEACFNLLTT